MLIDYITKNAVCSFFHVNGDSSIELNFCLIELTFGQIDVDIGSSTVANGVLGLVCGVITTLVVDMAFLVQVFTVANLDHAYYFIYICRTFIFGTIGTDLLLFSLKLLISCFFKALHFRFYFPGIPGYCLLVLVLLQVMTVVNYSHLIVFSVRQKHRAEDFFSCMLVLEIDGESNWK